MFRVMTKRVGPQVLNTVTKNVRQVGRDLVQGAAENELREKLNLPGVQTGKPNLGGAMASILREQYKNGNLANKGRADPKLKTGSSATTPPAPVKLLSQPQYRPFAAPVKYNPAVVPGGMPMQFPIRGNKA